MQGTYGMKGLLLSRGQVSLCRVSTVSPALRGVLNKLKLHRLGERKLLKPRLQSCEVFPGVSLLSSSILRPPSGNTVFPLHGDIDSSPVVDCNRIS